MSWPVAKHSAMGQLQEAWDPFGSQRRQRKARRQQSIRKAKYGTGMALGFLAVHWVKRAIRSIPIIGHLTSPLLDLAPTIMVGPALGAALVYGLEQGDIMAAGHKVRHAFTEVGKEVDTVFRDLHEEAAEVQRQHGETVQRVVGALDSGLQQAQREVVPILERQYRQALNGVATIKEAGIQAHGVLMQPGAPLQSLLANQGNRGSGRR